MGPHLNTCLREPVMSMRRVPFILIGYGTEEQKWKLKVSGNKLKFFLKKQTKKEIPFAGLCSYKVDVNSSILVFYCCLEIVTHLVV